MPLIDKTYFIGELDIPNSNNPNVGARIFLFIEKYEPKFLRLLFGGNLYAAYVAGIGETIIDPKWISLQQRLPNMIACYVYFYYMSDAASKSTGMGEAKPAVNGEQVSPASKLEKAWNEMADEVNDLYDYLNENQELYNWQYVSTAPSNWRLTPHKGALSRRTFI